ncbi:aldehyde dehydrogenase family protein [Permianibacter sp. IMCC34836]|uniref:aldehyde dehydrogenase family protein n=1 Tax=Permianibacter fluminis TaxID=2738515 RepID=UPI0015546589|nr:aldehyde dehydrogenase family protein [Permianibacter fluminis]NQD37820.1 aldehyde dehydrogenase family protein [Permianibacter fluminis]
MTEQLTISPIDGSICVRRPLATAAQIDDALSLAKRAQQQWRQTSIAERAALCRRAVDAFVANKADIAREITLQIGRPLRYTPNEVNGFEIRARHMIAIAESALAPVRPEPIEGFDRYIKREPVGVVLVVAPWNYPLLTAVNAIVPAFMSGNTVLIKHSAQTPLCAERIVAAFEAAGAPAGLIQFLHLSHEDTQKIIRDSRIGFVAFTGSVAGGAAVEQAAAGRFIGVGLELGGCDPAYVHADAALDHAVDTLVDGAMFNSGQSCCGIQRIYVHASRYDAFIERAAALTAQYQLGDPLQLETTLGPVVRSKAADDIRRVIAETRKQGGKPLLDESRFTAAKVGTAYVAPQMFADVNHSMGLMKEECFGPVVGIMKVRDEQEALALMNDSAYGLTASIFTKDLELARRLGDALETGTVFMNRCDYLDPALTWTGVKHSGRGGTLSQIGYEFLTRPKSYHLKFAL